MAEIKVPVIIDGFKYVEDMAEAVLNYTYKGKTLKEWTDSISSPHTNADLIRAMVDEELAKLIGDNIDCAICKKYFKTTTCPGSITAGEKDCYGCWLDWLKQECEDDNII